MLKINENNNYINSVDIQVKDIKEMFYSKNSILLQLYIMFIKNKKYSLLNDNDYVRIYSNKAFNRLIIHNLLKTKWILNSNILDSMSPQDIYSIIDLLNTRITELENKNNSNDKRLSLIKYHYDSLCNYINSREKNGVVLERKIYRML